MRMLWQSMPHGPKVVRTLQESADEHTAIIEALRAGDGERAADLTFAHIVGSTHLEEERPTRDSRAKSAPRKRPSRSVHKR